MELRCPGHLHAALVERRIEVRCRWCARDQPKGTVVLHYFNPTTGELIETQMFQDAAFIGSKKAKKEAN